MTPPHATMSPARAEERQQLTDSCQRCGGEIDSIEDPGNPGHYAPGYEPFCIRCGYQVGDNAVTTWLCRICGALNEIGEPTCARCDRDSAADEAALSRNGH